MDRFGIRHHIQPGTLPTPRAWFVKALKRGLTVKAMAEELGVQRTTVYKALNRYELPRPVPYRGGLAS
jgi:predicted DNA-binding transcriptional regulator AlpA